MDTRLFCQFVMTLVVTSLHVGRPCSLQCDPATAQPGIWVSNLRLSESTQTSLNVQWDPDAVGGGGYFLQFQLEAAVSFTTVTNLDSSMTSFNIQNLSPGTRYNLRVCRDVAVAGKADNCGSCVLCAATSQPEGPPSVPRTLTATTTPETILLEWMAPAELNDEDGIANYSVACLAESSNRSETVFSRTAFRFFGLAPNTRFDCSVVAFNRFGASSAASAIVVTNNRTSDPGALFIFIKPNLVYITITTTLITTLAGSPIDGSPTLLTYDGDLQDMDYDFQKNLLYFSAVETDGTNVIKIAQIQSNMFTITMQGALENLHELSSGVTVSHISVDWVNSELYYVETSSSNSRIMRLVLNDTGVSVLSQSCVVELANTDITNIKVDAVHGFFYYGTSTTLFRTDLSNIQVSDSSCPSSVSDAITLRVFTALFDFTIQQGEAIYFLGRQSSICNQNQNGLALSINLGAQSNETFAFGGSVGFNAGTALDSFTQFMVAATGEDIVFVRTDTLILGCGVLRDAIVRSASSPVSLIHVYRESQQPVPVPLSSPSSIAVSTDGSTAAVRWLAPTFPGALYSVDAFDGWIYNVSYCSVSSPETCMLETTTELSIQLSLSFDTSYLVSVRAIGPGGASTVSSQALFTTEPDRVDAKLVIAHETGIIRSSLGGQSAEMLVESTPVSVSADAYDNVIYWATEGSSATIYSRRGSIQTTLYTRRDQPFGLAYDWVGDRILWVEDGENPQDPLRSFIGQILPPSETSFAQAPNTVATVVDSFNGLFFWTDRNTISMQTLSRVPLALCHNPSGGASSLAVDPTRRKLYWLSNSATVSQGWKISQLDYSGTQCGTNLVEQDLPGLSLSSSSTVMVYASNKLFFASRLSNKIYTVSSRLDSVGAGQSLAMGEVILTGANIAGTLEIRDMAVLSQETQPLPGLLNSQNRGFIGLEPFVPSVGPSLNVQQSTISSVVVEWVESTINGLTNPIVFYEISYTLGAGPSPTSGTMIIPDTSITIPVNAPQTNVSFTLVPVSVWARSTRSAFITFLSLPNKPSEVLNVRVFLYTPLISDRATQNALVTWDGLEESVTEYTVRVVDYSTGMDLDLYQVELDVRTSYTVLLASRSPQVPGFPLVVGNMYGLEVTASNEGGAGPASQRVNFTVSATDLRFPMQVLSFEPSGVAYYGTDTGMNPMLSARSNAGPTVVDAVDRRVYWYDRNSSLIFSQVLGVNSRPQVYLTVPADRTLVSLAYDWIAKMVYTTRVITATMQLELLRFEAFDANVQTPVFPELQLTVSPQALINSEMNPVTGYFYWTITVGGVTSVYALNLRTDTAMTTITPVQVGSPNRRRRRRETLMDVTPALALDPIRDMLLVSDRASGNIYQCSRTFDSCAVYVNRSVLMMNSGRMEVGLPAGNIKYGGQLIYWTSENTSVPGLFAVDVSDLTVLIVVNNQTTPNFFVPLSPDQQPLPPLNCLTLLQPFLPANRQVVELKEATSTTLRISWTNGPNLVFPCSDVFSLAPFVYSVSHERSGEARTIQMTRRRSIVLTDLIPFTGYTVGVLGINQYSSITGTLDFFAFSPYSTTEGVPDPPLFDVCNVTGTTTATIRWFHLLQNGLRGRVDNRFYIISVGGVNLTTSQNSIDVTGPRAALLTIRLFSSNNVSVSSTGSQIMIQLWSLVQQPSRVFADNDTIVVNVTVSETFVGNINGIGVTACDVPVTTEEFSSCSCPYSNRTEDHRSEFFQTVDSMSRPVTLSFMLANLTVYTRYCVLPIGLYSTPEVAAGEGVVISTGSGVPEAPKINLTENSMLQWNRPAENGDMITSYTVIFRPRTRPDVDMVMDRLNFQDKTYDLSSANIMTAVEYTITMFATNGNGNSEESNMVMFESPTVFPLTVVAASAAVGGTVLLSIIIIIIIILCFLKARNTKRELRLSYMYGPDHELSNLRNAISRSNGQNPHYTWSIDDYQYSDDHLNLLTKFPRNNLKLETFIDRGEFGEVFQGTATDILGAGTGPTPVAVKTLRKGATTEEQRKFLAEASLMGNFNHPNILKVLGVCVDNDPVYIILELMPGGDLLKFLRKAKMDHGPTLLTLPEQIQVALDVAHGCYYLEQQHFIHRDIAARNCLVSSKGADRVVKIGDFGLAKDLYSSDYYQVEGQRKLPVRWMAPEALLQGKFTVESDIWSYGVLLWEIMTLGNQPYPGRINQEVLQFVTGGGRLDKPDKCPSKIYQLMQNCWRRYASDRPHFEPIVNTLTTFLDRLKRPDSIYNSDSDSDDEESNHVRQGSNKLPARTPSMRSTGRGIMNLARSGSMKLRNSFRRHNSTQKREEHMTNSQQDDFRERGPF